MLSSAEITGGRGNPFSAIGANAFRTTNCPSQSAMRGAEFHGNTGRDGQPAYPVWGEGAGREGSRERGRGLWDLGGQPVVRVCRVTAHCRWVGVPASSNTLE